MEIILNELWGLLCGICLVIAFMLLITDNKEEMLGEKETISEKIFRYFVGYLLIMAPMIGVLITTV